MKNFNNYFKLATILAVIFMVGCKLEKPDDPLSSVYQTQWKGAASFLRYYPQGVLLMEFDSDSTGVFAYLSENGNEVYSDFMYDEAGQVITIRDCASPFALNGAWWIRKLTRSELILQKRVNTSNEDVLTLSRIN